MIIRYINNELYIENLIDFKIIQPFNPVTRKFFEKKEDAFEYFDFLMSSQFSSKALSIDLAILQNEVLSVENEVDKNKDFTISLTSDSLLSGEYEIKIINKNTGEIIVESVDFLNGSADLVVNLPEGIYILPLDNKFIIDEEEYSNVKELETFDNSYFEIISI